MKKLPLPLIFLYLLLCAPETMAQGCVAIRGMSSCVAPGHDQTDAQHGRFQLSAITVILSHFATLEVM